MAQLQSLCDSTQSPVGKKKKKNTCCSAPPKSDCFALAAVMSRCSGTDISTSPAVALHSVNQDHASP